MFFTHSASTPALLVCNVLFIGVVEVTATVLASDGKLLANTLCRPKY